MSSPCTQILDTNIDQQIKGLARQTGTSDYTVVFSAFTLLLHHYSGQEEILAGMPTSTLLSLPASKAWENTMGYMVNPVVIRSQTRQTQETLTP